MELGWAHWFAGDHEAAIAGYERSIELDPARSEPHFRRAQLELSRGNLTEALEHARFSEQLAGDTIRRPGITSEYAYLYSRVGALDDAIRMADRVTGNASTHLARGNHGQALALLQADAERRELNGLPPPFGYTLSFIIWNTFNDPILDQPEWIQVRERLGFIDL